METKREDRIRIGVASRAGGRVYNIIAGILFGELRGNEEIRSMGIGSWELGGALDVPLGKERRRVEGMEMEMEMKCVNVG